MNLQLQFSSTRSKENDTIPSPDAMLARLVEFLADDLAQVDSLIRGAMESEIGLTDEIGRYLQSAGGKRLRPMLTLLAARILGGSGEKARPAAATVELLHLASLLHDDVIDHAALRRGRPTVNTQWGIDVAILMADYIYSRAWAVALDWLPAGLLAVFCRVAATMCNGEMFQIEKRDQLLTEEDYLYVIRCKTAALFSACTRVGAAIAGADERTVAALEQYGLALGCAFQITDDVLDLTADPQRLGKEIGTDVASGKQTLPLIRALEQAHPDDRAFLLDALRNGGASERVLECVVKYGGLEHALEVARRHADEARSCLDDLPHNPALDFLSDLSELVVNRAY